MLVSISEGLCLEGLLGAIFFRDSDMLAAAAAVVVWSGEKSGSDISFST